ncbi:unnamed protein product [Paramecium octaurelia]|uniref:CCDC81 HU domain-containing protein n=1 Tax=Paramecium octaurelia TaxID=43137 RepID=A0A8S1T110_PAROT|nr:unnamed protein product [Paramecium octaurelia]CAD8146055.1 unnamed protein product [Paramecium octaurelia]
MNISGIVDWILLHPIQYPGRHNHQQQRTLSIYRDLTTKDQFLLVINSLKELLQDCYSKGNSLHIHNFGTFSFEFIGPTSQAIPIKQSTQLKQLPKLYQNIRPCFIVDPYLQKQLSRYSQKDEINKSRGVGSIYNQGHATQFCNPQTLSNMCYVDKLTIESILKTFTQAINDLIRMGHDVNLDFGLSIINVKNKNLQYMFDEKFVNFMNQPEFTDNFLKSKPITCNIWKNEKSIQDKNLNEIYFAPCSPYSLVTNQKTKNLMNIKDMTSVQK